MTARVIAFEGAPLVGKTTQAERLADWLRNRGLGVSLLQRATDRCPTRERINELRERADGFTREVISVERETELWAQYYAEKNETIAADAASDDIDIVIADRYGLSLLPVQEPALDDPLDDLVERFGHLAGGTDDTLVLTAARSALKKRYRKREGEEPPADFLAEVERIQRNYRALEAHADLRYVDTTGRAVDVVQRSVRAALSLD